MIIRSSLPTRLNTALFGAKVLLLQMARSAKDRASRVERFRADEPTGEEIVLAESVTPLWTAESGGAERALTLGKIENLRIAARRLHGVVIPAHRTFSFWRHVGRATRRAGYVRGRELREGCVVPSIGGGLCQLSNALYDAALRAGFTIVERHAHTAVVAGSLAAAGRDATVFWNYVDLRFRSAVDVRIEATLTSESLIVRFCGSVAAARTAPSSGDLTAALDETPGGCASCGMDACFRHRELHRVQPRAERTAFLVDDYWPEYDAYVNQVACSGDTLHLPIDGQRFGKANYEWNTAAFTTVFESRFHTALRGYRSRGVALQGAARQRLLLAWADRMARRFASQVSYEVTHLVVMQHLLPALWRTGVLGGRTYDVLMTGMPVRALEQTLDAAARLHPQSPTLADFRADPQLFAAEDAALAGARTIVTPHAAVAAMFGSRAVRLDWALPEASPIHRPNPKPAAIVFPGATLGRKGAYEVRSAAIATETTVLLCGPELEGAGFWDGVSVERHASFRSAAARADVVVLPAFVEAQPRWLLLALSLGLRIVASAACGLGDLPDTVTIAAGDVDALCAAVMDQLTSKTL
ncbi:MAG: hypothetical protein JWO85_3116 [Candidatus Eremiobacteraeota bacterium]|jgi:hypothetical protein|nr:hypothetical protein [Candidatus Eremiobacteraeota bacterium]